MPDKAHRDTDKLIEELEKELSAVYSRAQNELTVKAGQYFVRFNELDKQKQKLVDAGKLTEEEFKKWRQNKMLTGEHWQRMVEESARLVSEANKMALQYINGRLPEVYATNYNFTAGAMEKSLGQAVSFELINTDAVKYILDNVDSNLLPKKILDPTKDIPWNMKLVNSEVMQGIIQGEAIPKIAKRLKNVGVRNNESAVRAARTIVTQTENKARFDCAKAAEEKGILTKKRWVATGDSRTRDAHMEAWNTYGTRETAISIDEPFIVGGEKMMFAGDPNGSPWNVYNCRCATPHFAAGFSSILPPERQGKIRVSFMDGQASAAIGTGATSTENRFTTSNIIYSDKLSGVKWNESKAIINSLAQEYNTKLKEVRPGAHKGAGDTQISGSIMHLSSTDLTVALHEFAHTISMENQTKYGLYNESDFWKEIKKVQRQYKKEVGNDTTRWISAYEHSSKGADEFLAEAFTQAKAYERGIKLPSKYGKDLTYSMKALEIIDKYFKKKRL